MNSTGSGYSGQAWQNNEIIQYLLQHKISGSSGVIYSDDPYVVYYLANQTARRSPEWTSTDPAKLDRKLSDLKGTWPAENNALLVWFDLNDPSYYSYYFTVDELQTVASIDLIAQFKDGGIYSVKRK